MSSYALVHRTLHSHVETWEGAGQSCSLEWGWVVLSAQLFLHPVIAPSELQSTKVPGLCKFGPILWYKHKASVWGHRWQVGHWREAVSSGSSFQGRVWELHCSQPGSVIAQGCREWVAEVSVHDGKWSLVSPFHPFTQRPYSSATMNQTPLFRD